MGRSKSIDYSKLYSFDKKKGLYYAVRTINGKKKRFYAKDANALHDKVTEAENVAEVPITFREIAEGWHDMKWPTIALNTQVGYAPYYKRAVDEFGDIPVKDIIPADINRIILEMKNKGYSSQTVKAQKSVLKMIFDYAITKKPPIILYNPVSSITVPRGLPKKHRPTPSDEVMQIVIDSVHTATFGLFPFFLLFTGCRRAEAIAVTWGDIDYKKKEIRISKEYTYPNGMPHFKEPKTEAGIRYVPLLPPLENELQRPKNAKDVDLIFSGENGKPLQENAYNRRWMHYCKDVGLIVDEPEERVSKTGRKYTYHKIKPAITAHQLRHGYATILMESKIDDKTIQIFVGHKDIQTTKQIYIDLRQRHKKSEVNKVKKYISKSYKVRTEGATDPGNA